MIAVMSTAAGARCRQSPSSVDHPLHGERLSSHCARQPAADSSCSADQVSTRGIAHAGLPGPSDHAFRLHPQSYRREGAFSRDSRRHAARGRSGWRFPATEVTAALVGQGPACAVRVGRPVRSQARGLHRAPAACSAPGGQPLLRSAGTERRSRTWPEASGRRAVTAWQQQQAQGSGEGGGNLEAMAGVRAGMQALPAVKGLPLLYCAGLGPMSTVDRPRGAGRAAGRAGLAGGSGGRVWRGVSG